MAKGYLFSKYKRNNESSNLRTWEERKEHSKQNMGKYNGLFFLSFLNYVGQFK